MLFFSCYNSQSFCLLLLLLSNPPQIERNYAEVDLDVGAAELRPTLAMKLCQPAARLCSGSEDGVQLWTELLQYFSSPDSGCMPCSKIAFTMQ